MAHKTDTQSPLISMPRQTGLLLRKGRYYFNFRIPTDLRSLYGKKEFLRGSLNTSDLREAKEKIYARGLEAKIEFKKRRKCCPRQLQKGRS
jgi:hypothetical protein